jgi:hypothetical protein
MVDDYESNGDEEEGEQKNLEGESEESEEKRITEEERKVEEHRRNVTVMLVAQGEETVHPI